MGAILKNVVEFQAVCGTAGEAGWIALDTEFVWMRTYYAEMGIVQMGVAGGECRILDCRRGMSPAALGELLASAETVKILHSARQDLWHLRHYTGCAACRVFDTQVAAAFAGFAYGIGLQKLLAEGLNVNLPKSETRTDWTRRPLTAEQIKYALDDVRYLDELRGMLLAKAEELGTRGWLEEEMRKFDEPGCFEDAAPGEAWKRVKGARNLNGSGRAVLRELAATREKLAMELNQPRAWLGDDGSMLQMAFQPEANLERPRFRHRLKNRKTLDDVARAYAAALKAGLATPESEWPEALDEGAPWVQDVLPEAMAWLEGRAAEIHVAPGMVASKSAVGSFLAHPEGFHDLAKGWRLEAAGRDLLSKFG